MICAHCGADVEVPEAVYDGERFGCDGCGGTNVVSVDDAGDPDDLAEAWFQECDAPDCAACQKAGLL